MFERDEFAMFVVQKDEGAGTNTVHVNGVLVGTFKVGVADVFAAQVPPSAEAGSAIELTAAGGKLLVAGQVIERTNFSGNIVYTSDYGDTIPDINECLYLYSYLFEGGPAPSKLEHANVDGNGVVDVHDLVTLYDHVVGASTWDQPRGDVRYDGSFTDSTVFLATFVDDWGNGVSWATA